MKKLFAAINDRIDKILINRAIRKFKSVALKVGTKCILTFSKGENMSPIVCKIEGYRMGYTAPLYIVVSIPDSELNKKIKCRIENKLKERKISDFIHGTVSYKLVDSNLQEINISGDSNLLSISISRLINKTIIPLVPKKLKLRIPKIEE